MANLTPKQEAFCLSYIETGNASEAYRRAYDAKNMGGPSINVEASKLMDAPKIALRCAELSAAHVERHKFTVDDMIAQLDEDRDFARKLDTPAAAISASMGKAKVLGFLVEKVDVSAKLTIGREFLDSLG
jgi:phage terminase small subunit